MQRKANWKRLSFTVAILAIMAALSTPAVDAGERMVVRIDEPFIINGELYPSGKLTVEAVRDYNPSLTMNEVTVNGRSLGLLVAEKVVMTDDVSASSLNFIRDDSGRLVLIGFDWLSHAAQGSFRLRTAGQG